MKNKTKLFILFFIAAAVLFLFINDYSLKSSKQGLEYEEHLRVNPPPPRNLSGILLAGYIELRWYAPETVKVPHNYSDIITHYNIYRGTSLEDISYYGSASDLTFKDFNISQSTQYIYEIVAVHEGSMQSVPTQEVIIQTSRAIPSGLTYEEQLRVKPPPPRNLSGILRAGYIELRWDVPETVKVPHNYSDIITHYNIYRGTSLEDISYYGSASDLTFKDFNISQSTQYIYEIVAVHEGSMQSVPTQEVIIQTSRAIPSGLTYEEHLRVKPPPPRNLGGILRAGYIELRWDVPETVKVPHNYSDIITHYNIYRGTSLEDISYYGSASDLTFKDFNISQSTQYIYEIVAVHEGSMQSVPTQEVIIQN